MSLGDLFPSGRVAAIAHRGGSKLRPENTLAAFDHAASLGVDGFECDVHLSRDGVPVVIHDATLDRTTAGSGSVTGRTAKELGAIDAGARFGESAGFPFRDSGHGVPTLADLIDRHPDIPIVVEVKGDDPKVVAPVVSVLRASRRPRRYVLGGFSQPVLDAIRRVAPELPTGASRDEVKAAIRRSYLRIPPRRTGYAVFQVPFMFQGKQIFRWVLCPHGDAGWRSRPGVDHRRRSGHAAADSVGRHRSHQRPAGRGSACCPVVTSSIFLLDSAVPRVVSCTLSVVS
jgi:glycerophosphoryl diester phosphodiesterase